VEGGDTRKAREEARARARARGKADGRRVQGRKE